MQLSEQGFIELGQIIQLGYEPVRIDLITSIESMDFQEIWKNRTLGQYGRQQVPFIGLNDLIACKKLAKGSQDLADLEILKEIVKKKN